MHGRFSGFGLPVNWIAADILRIENGILVEHWDVIQDEATEEQSKSKAPMFGSSFPVYSKSEKSIRISRNGEERSASFRNEERCQPSRPKQLLSPYSLGDLQLKNRIVMAPLTRTRAENQGKVPNELMAEYYAQRAGAGSDHHRGHFCKRTRTRLVRSPGSLQRRTSAPDGSGLQMPFIAQAG